MKKNILFIGGSGLLALNWANQIKDDYNIILGIHNRDVKLNGIKSKKLKFNIESDFETFLKKYNIEIIINCAGITNVEFCEANPKIAFEVNSYLPQMIAVCSYKLNIKLIHISTDHLFEGSSSFYSEEEIPSPLNIYGKSKYDGELKVIKNNPNSIIIRTNFYGWGTTYRNSFSDYIISNLRMNKTVDLFEDVYYTPILIETLVFYTHQLINLGASGIFNLVGNEKISKYDFGLLLAQTFNLKKSLIIGSKFSERTDLTKRPLDLSLSNKKLSLFLDLKIEDIENQINKLHNQEYTGFCKNIMTL